MPSGEMPYWKWQYITLRDMCLITAEDKNRFKAVIKDLQKTDSQFWLERKLRRVKLGEETIEEFFDKYERRN